MRDLVQEAMETAIEKRKLFCSEGTFEVLQPRYMARVYSGGATKYEWVIRINSNIGSTDDRDCFASGMYKFKATKRINGRGLRVSVEQVFL